MLICLPNHPQITAGCAVIAAAALVGCSSTPPSSKPILESDIQAKVIDARASRPASVVFRAGDTYASAFRSLGLLDGKNYIVDTDLTQTLEGNSTPVLNADDAVAYFSAHNQTVKLSPVEGTQYVRVKISKTISAAKVKASSKCEVNIVGTVPMGAVVTTIAEKVRPGSRICRYGCSRLGLVRGSGLDGNPGG